VSDPALQPTHDDPHHLVRVALQETPADLVVLGGTLANVYTGELLDGWGVAVSGSRIALTGPEAERCVGEATTVVEARGQVIAPGFIDAHTHLDYWPALLEGRTDLRMLALGGGLVVAADGVVRAEIPLPVGGIISNEPIPILAEQINRFQRALRELGCIRENPFLAAQVLTFTAIPSLRIRERGLWDVHKGQPVPLIAEEEGV
jgi:adenine deaminase